MECAAIMEFPVVEAPDRFRRRGLFTWLKPWKEILTPPATRTLPSRKRLAVAPWLRTRILPVSVQRPVAGS